MPRNNSRKVEFDFNKRVIVMGPNQRLGRATTGRKQKLRNRHREKDSDAKMETKKRLFYGLLIGASVFLHVASICAVSVYHVYINVWTVYN